MVELQIGAVVKQFILPVSLLLEVEEGLCAIQTATASK